MRPATGNKSLGDLSAEFDHQMLSTAFYETPDYKTIVEGTNLRVIVGRRGTGKSALFARLGKYWCASSRTALIQIAPDEHQLIGLRPSMKVFGSKFSHIRAGAKLAWKYALMMQIGDHLLSSYGAKNLRDIVTLSRHVKEWRQSDEPVPAKLRGLLNCNLNQSQTSEQAIADFAESIELSRIDQELRAALLESRIQFFIMIDRLDEGYEPDLVGNALVAGCVYALIELNHSLPKLKAFVFLRDNIFRAIALVDPDYSKSIEGQVLRLHWEEYDLLNMVANRLRVAFSLTHEQSLRVWDECTSRDLRGKDGFRRCLRLTLYRPRDLLLLLNNAFLRAGKHGREAIENNDLETAAKDISTSRLTDIIREYESIVPGLERFCRCFADLSPEISLDGLRTRLERVSGEPSFSAAETQHYVILDGPEDIIRSLYSVGFLGIRDHSTGSFVFSHDGKRPDLEFSPKSHFLVHPCYWLALNLASSALSPEEATEIHDEYDIEVSSETPLIRNRRIGKMIAELDAIPEGAEGASRFEDWCERAIKVLFAGGLRNVELKPNGQAVQRRDIVARNHEGTSLWKRIFSDYGTRQVLFEVKNYSELGPDEYRQMLSYLTSEYGNLGFIVTRADSESLEKGKELDWAREMYRHSKTIVKLTGKQLTGLLSKLRSPQKHDAADKAINGLLDRYQRMYFSANSSRTSASTKS